MSGSLRRLAAGAVAVAAGMAWAAAEPAGQSAALSGRVSNALPVVLYLGNSHIGSQVPEVMTQLVGASTPPLAIRARHYLRGAHALSEHWQRPPQPAKGGSLLSWIRYPDPPRPAFTQTTLAEWGERRPDSAIIQPFGEQFDEEQLQFWVGLYRRALAKRGIRPILYVSHQGRSEIASGNFLFPFEDEAAGARLLEQVHAACLRVAVEYEMDVAPSYLACYRAKKARPDFPLHRVDSTDRGHAGPNGHYLEACVIYGVLFNRSPEGLPVRLAPGAKPSADLDERVHVRESALTDEEARFLQKTAWDSILEFRRLAADRKAAAAAGTLPALTPRPRVLVIGAPYNDAFRRDASTSWKRVPAGYRAVLRERVKKQAGAEVIFAPLGPCSAGEARVELDDSLGGRPWTLVAFGWGARELEDGTPPDEYEKNLRALLPVLKENGSPLLWTGFVPVKRRPGVPEWTGERDLDTVPNIVVARDRGPLQAVAEKVLQEHGVTADPEYAGRVAEQFAPGGQPAAEREVIQEDWMALGEWLADSLAKSVNANPIASPAGRDP